jgi:hypothetical protein
VAAFFAGIEALFADVAAYVDEGCSISMQRTATAYLMEALRDPWTAEV